jgi:formate dehydrogenase subunit gamma
VFPRVGVSDDFTYAEMEVTSASICAALVPGAASMTSPPVESVTGRVALVRAIATQHVSERGALMPVLHDVVEELGHVAREDIETIADVLNLSVAEVYGVVSFYKDFRTDPPSAHTVALCRGEACQSVGAEELYADTRARSGELGRGEGDVEVDEVFCLGNCALGPSGTLDGRLHGRLSRERIAAMTEGWR